MEPGTNMKFIDENTVQISNGKTGETKTVAFNQLPTYGISPQFATDARNIYKYGGTPSLLQDVIEALPTIAGAVGATVGSAAVPIPGVGGAIGGGLGNLGGSELRGLLESKFGIRATSKQNEIKDALTFGATTGAIDLLYSSFLTSKTQSALSDSVSGMAKKHAGDTMGEAELWNKVSGDVTARQYGNEYMGALKGRFDNFIKPQLVDGEIDPEGLLNARRAIANVMNYDSSSVGVNQVIDKALRQSLTNQFHEIVPEAANADWMFHTIAGIRSGGAKMGSYIARRGIWTLMFYPIFKAMTKTK